MRHDQLSAIISADPEVQGGAPVFRGTRVPVQSLFDHLKAGESINDFLEGFPNVRREQVIALLEEARRHAFATGGSIVLTPTQPALHPAKSAATAKRLIRKNSALFRRLS
jgi:uncharacterized protein (DUF433 family)